MGDKPARGQQPCGQTCAKGRADPDRIVIANDIAEINNQVGPRLRLGYGPKFKQVIASPAGQPVNAVTAAQDIVTGVTTQDVIPRGPA